MYRIDNDASNNSSIVVCVSVAVVTFLPSSCVARIGDTYTITKGDGRDL
jgi:hypothetical protein